MSDPYSAPDPYPAPATSAVGGGTPPSSPPVPYGQLPLPAPPQPGGGVSEQAFRAQSDYDDAKKQLAVAYVLWFFLGALGAHRFYLRERGTAIAMLLISLTVVGLLVTAVWALVDAFLIPGMTERLNRQIKQEAYGRRGLSAY